MAKGALATAESYQRERESPQWILLKPLTCCLESIFATKKHKRHKGFANRFVPFVPLCGYKSDF